jgi:hypothetical protein
VWQCSYLNLSALLSLSQMRSVTIWHLLYVLTIHTYTHCSVKLWQV